MPAHFEGGGTLPNRGMSIGGTWKAAGFDEWKPLSFGEPLDIRTLPPEGPQPVRWVAQPPLEDHPEHYHAIIAPLMHLYHFLTRH